ncbi:MAG: ribonuclease E/G [Acetobacteraceae bacterium]|nr:ribonuclease E/G [Acetobacteraceae bacterium]
MSKRMLIDATHAEETRVVVLDGNRLEDFDIETSTKRQLKGNIYLAKVVRVEPSLQAAFVEYGGNRHGFLAFSEIHPDYYQIPIADRQRLLDMQAEDARLEEEEDDLELALSQAAAAAPSPPAEPHDAVPDVDAAAPPSEPAASSLGPDSEPWAQPDFPRLTASPPPVEAWASADLPALLAAVAQPAPEPTESWALAALPALISPQPSIAATTPEPAFADDDQPDTGDDLDMFGGIPEEPPPETVGGDADSVDDAGDDRQERRIPPRFLRNYHIQEVIHRRQILLVQVVKEERGTKGAALTTYLSLAGRFSVLMPNSPRGGGISRKITSATDRRRLKEVMVELDIPKGMGLIVRTAGAQRPKPEIKRDCEYLLRLWDDIRDHTLKSIAPALIYEEASLIKRAIRDVYSREIDDITVDGEDGWRAAHEFMRMLMPSHARKVIHWPDQGQSLFARFQVEAQLDAMMQPTVQLRSGGYLVINQAEALVAIDVNSGRSTRERNVEETALRTNLEAADEVARQLRLRDLAGLIVIDFIDMESKRHNAMVERRIKDALKDDRARIQLGHISHFGLMEMSRQRLRPSLEETTLIVCPHCNGTGHVRGTESAALHVLRGVEEEAGKRRSAEAIVHVATPIALYILNHKRERLNEIEHRYGMRVIIAADDSLIAPRFKIDRVRALAPGEEPRFVTPDAPRPALVAPPEAIETEEEDDEIDDGEDAADADGSADGAATGVAGAEDTEESREAERRRRRRKRRGGRGDPVRGPDGAAEPAPSDEVPVAAERAESGVAPVAEPSAADDEAARRRSRRGRRRRRDDDGNLSPLGVPGAEQPDLIPVYAGPTPADPFGGQAFDIFDAMEQVELAAAPPRRAQANRRGGPGDSRMDGRVGGSHATRSRWQPLSWAVASEPPMLVTEPASDRPDRGSQTEAWAMPQRPFMLRRDRHAPRWGQQRGAPRGPEVVPEVVVAAGAEVWADADEPRMLSPEPLAPRPAPVTVAIEAGPIEAGPPPAPELVPTAPEPVADLPIVEITAPKAAEAQAELPWAAAPVEAEEAPVVVTVAPAKPHPAPEPEPPPVPANDVVAGPVIQPIIIGSEAAAPVEVKRGWWRRR